MMTTPKYLVDKAKKTIKEIQKINPTEVLKSKYKDATPEERKKVDEINKKLCTFDCFRCDVDCSSLVQNELKSLQL